MVPVVVYQPGSATTTPAPEDYLSYLRSQVAHGAQLADETGTLVDGRPATILTATTEESLNGSLGCPAIDMPVADCFGLQPGFEARIAVIDVDGRTVLAWARETTGSPDTADVFADFEEMLATLRFR